MHTSKPDRQCRTLQVQMPASRADIRQTQMMQICPLQSQNLLRLESFIVVDGRNHPVLQHLSRRIAC
jgi:hypothetical protein